MKRYGLTDAEKARLHEFESKEFEALPWNIPINYWESHELKTLNTYYTKQAFKWLGEKEKEIKERKK